MTLNSAQKILYFSLLALIGLMIFFTLLSLKYSGQEGYELCIREKCAERGNDYCQKGRELFNCCKGAGGRLAQEGAEFVCVF